MIVRGAWVRSLCLPAAVLTLTATVQGCRKPAEPPAAKATSAVLPLTGRVVDAAHVLSHAQAHALEQLSERLEHDTRVQFVVATTPSLKGSPIERYTLTLANALGLGDRRRNDGLLLLVAPTDRKVRIEVGRGLERRLPDAECAQIVDAMLPHFRAGDLPGGIALSASRLDIELSHSSTSVH